ncbi:MAG TPA: GNAT family N-acetyltransferase [Chitinophagales bacterium]
MNIIFKNEFEIDAKTKDELNKLLVLCFPETNYHGRTFFKQMPHYRLILYENKQVIGQLAIDYRSMNLNGELVNVMGIIDLAILPGFQGKGYGTLLMNEFEKIASNNANNIDFLFLVTDKSKFYKRLGYKATSLVVSWLKIHQTVNYGIGKEEVNDCTLMYKSIGNNIWCDGELDMLGYWY